MKVLLVNPTRERVFQHSSLGLLYVAASLRAAGHDVAYIEGTRGQLQHELTFEFYWNKPEAVGFTVMSPMLQDVLYLAKHVKFLNPKCLVVAGGPHATLQPQDLLNGNVDFCIIGEGERSFVELLGAGHFEDVMPQGLAWKENKLKVEYSEPRQPLQDLDSLIPPARDLLNKQYFKKHSVSIMASRGCPFNCYFCQPTLRKLFGSTVRWRSAFSVVGEMLSCADNFRVNHFEFFDDTFTANSEFVNSFCEWMSQIRPKYNLSWEILTRVNMVDKQQLIDMKAAGLSRITFGVESGSQEILDYYKKGITVDQIKNAFQLCHEVGIKTHALFMVGAPVESWHSIHLTEQLIDQIKPDSIFVSITTPLPGTGLALDCGGAQDLSQINYYSRPLMQLKYLSPGEVVATRKRILRNFYFKKALDPRFAWSFLGQRSWSYTGTVLKNILGN